MRTQELDVLEWEQCYFIKVYNDLAEKMECNGISKEVKRIKKGP